MQLVALLGALVVAGLLAVRFGAGPPLPDTSPRATPRETLEQVQQRVEAAGRSERQRADEVMGIPR
jgi:hypothetical protein